MPDIEVKALVSWCGNRTKAGETRPRVGKARAAATPPAFRDVLLAIARDSRLATLDRDGFARYDPSMSFRYVAMGEQVTRDPAGAAKALTRSMRLHANNMGEVAKAHGVHRETLAAWFDRLEEAGHPVEGRGAAKTGRKPGSGKAKVAELAAPRGRQRRAAAA